MALGTARLFNINLTDNFNRPYLATSVAQFWRRWHISFSSWLQDYLFKPLQMRMRNWKSWGSVIALLITFFISGLWHGAAWTFVIWGLIHGLYMAVAVLYKPLQKKIYKKLKLNGTKILKLWKILITFNLVSFAWMFFRAESLRDAGWIVRNLLSLEINGQKSSIYQLLRTTLGGLGITKVDMVIVFLSVCFFAIVNFSQMNKDFFTPVKRSNLVVRWIFYTVLVITVFLFAKTGDIPYLYFQF